MLLLSSTKKTLQDRRRPQAAFYHRSFREARRPSPDWSPQNAEQGGEEGGTIFGKDVLGVLSSGGDTNILATALSSTGLAAELPVGCLLFAPNDDAFVALAKRLGTTKLGLLSRPELRKVLEAHIVLAQAPGQDFEAISLAGGTIRVAGGAAASGDRSARITGARECTNGRILFLDAVLQ